MTEAEINAALDRIRLVLDAYGKPYAALMVDDTGRVQVILKCEMSEYRFQRLRETAAGLGVGISGITWGADQPRAGQTEVTFVPTMADKAG